MRDIDRAKEIFNFSDYMSQNYNVKVTRNRISKCPFCSHKSNHISIIKERLIYSYNGCIKTMDAVAFFIHEGLTEDEAINKLLALTGINKDATIKPVEVKTQQYKFDKFYEYLVNEYKKRLKIKEVYKNLKMSEKEMLKIDLECDFFNELTDKIIYETEDNQLDEIEKIKNNFARYFNTTMSLKYKKYSKMP